ncbi:hypothetical protein LEP1GSC061_1457 [Leptospira wolffii serovar Khorat str. Khorat-H2]|nr:hypothetical protein LEP1GSC061_1457 [Leptospira wolffii serovar Khorat str. Khorat-H2]
MILPKGKLYRGKLRLCRNKEEPNLKRTCIFGKIENLEVLGPDLLTA